MRVKRGVLRLVLVFVTLSAAATARVPQDRTGTSDTSPHTSNFVTVNGLRLHYLDWFGTGDTLLLLAGGDDAHVFDSFAPKFIDRWRDMALTRRGYGESDKASGGYDRLTLIDDIRQYLDALKIGRIHMIGHSMAADELTLFASRYPTRTGKLIYLDPPFDDREGDINSLLTIPGLPPAQMRFALEALGSPDAANVSVPILPATGRIRPGWSKVFGKVIECAVQAGKESSHRA